MQDGSPRCPQWSVDGESVWSAMTKVLLVMDAQCAVVDHFGTPQVLEHMTAAVGAARSARIPVIFVSLALRSGFPEIALTNKLFSELAANAAEGTLSAEAPGSQIHPALQPRANEPVVLKRRISAFVGSDLEVLLRGLQATSLVLAGISTSGVVLSTFLDAADRDFKLTVLADACTDPEADLHSVLMEKLFPKQATVLSVAEWAGGLSRND